ncbi:MAG: divergent polysaccharide deacetylase family protein [Pseudomonadota bacterium]
MAGNWKKRRRRKEESGGSFIGGLLKGVVAGSVVVVGGIAALAYLVPPGGDGAGTSRLAERANDGIEDAADREAEGRSGPRSTGSFADAASSPSGVEVAAVPSVSAPSVNRPAGGLAPAGAPTGPSAEDTASSGLSFTIGEQRPSSPSLQAPGAIGASASSFGSAPVPPGGSAPVPPGGGRIAPPGGLSSASAGTPVGVAPADATTMTADEARAALAALEQEEETVPAPVADPSTLTPEQARAALAELERSAAETAVDAAPAEPADVDAVTVDPASLSAEEARAALAALEAETAAQAESDAEVVGLSTEVEPSPAPIATPGLAPVTSGDGIAGAQATLDALGSTVGAAPTTGSDETTEADETAETVLALADPAANAAVVPPIPGIDVPPPARPRLDPEQVFEAGGNAFATNARSFELAAGSRPMAVILRAPDGASVDAAALTGVDLPLTLALRGEASDETALAEAVHAAGIEIVAEVGSAVGETLARLPVAVAAMTGPDQGPAEGMTDMLSRYGIGYVDARTIGNGSALRAATRAGVPSTGVDRKAPEGAAEADLYRALQVAAGVARRQGSAVLVLPATPAALRAAMQWQLERGARGEVSLAPLSAVMRARQG